MRRTIWAWVTPSAFLAATLLAGCGGGGGGGGSSSGGSGGGGGQTTPFAVTATPEHGYIALSWNAPSDATSATTYSISRETAGGSTFVTPVNYSGAAGSLPSTTLSFNDYPTGAAGANATDPAINTNYVYKVTATTGSTVETTALTGSVTPVGPSAASGSGGTGVSDSSGNAVPNDEPYNQSVNSSAGVLFNYTLSSGGVPSLTINATTDYTPTTADLQNVKITINGNTSAVYTAAQLGSALTLNASTKTFTVTLNGGSLPSGVSLPAIAAGGLLTVNIYVPKATGSTTLTLAQYTAQLHAPGSGPVGEETPPLEFILNNQ